MRRVTGTVHLFLPVGELGLVYIYVCSIFFLYFPSLVFFCFAGPFSSLLLDARLPLAAISGRGDEGTACGSFQMVACSRFLLLFFRGVNAASATLHTRAHLSFLCRYIPFSSLLSGTLESCCCLCWCLRVVPTTSGSLLGGCSIVHPCGKRSGVVCVLEGYLLYTAGATLLSVDRLEKSASRGAERDHKCLFSLVAGVCYAEARDQRLAVVCESKRRI